jgi:hypothetical protein
LYCMNCGTYLPDEAGYCWKCGKAQVRPDGPPSETTATLGAESQPTNLQPGKPVTVTRSSSDCDKGEADWRGDN